MLPAQGWLPGSIPRHGAKRTSLLRIFADKREGSQGCPVPSTGLEMEPGPFTSSRLPKGGGEDAAQTAVLTGLFWVIIKSPSNPSREKVWGTFPLWLHRPPEKKELVIHRSSSSSSFPHQSQDQPQSLAANYFSIYLLFTKVKIPLALLKKQQIQQKWFWKF